ncbi:hypothetical protein BpHYR1_041256 [Brachionus plicatilis]|uniref:Uncharacterized protein n=1 Tax=Brachionus plicatilis TaxID=10195 RepID=A0A3M7PCV9_BRAPC|nr:hypothetical protein BpHYR1_041256 [Brachionus plicatilis]
MLDVFSISITNHPKMRHLVKKEVNQKNNLRQRLWRIQRFFIKSSIMEKNTKNMRLLKYFSNNFGKNELIRLE